MPNCTFGDSSLFLSSFLIVIFQANYDIFEIFHIIKWCFNVDLFCIYQEEIEAN